jgi:hypothetical protein
MCDFAMHVFVTTVLIIGFLGLHRSQNNTIACIFLWQDWWKFERCRIEMDVCAGRHRLRGVTCIRLEDVFPVFKAVLNNEMCRNNFSIA